MQKNKQYYNISEVSKIIDIKEHVIRHWDSIDPKSKNLRIEGLSIRTKGGTRYFNNSHIKKLLNIKKILFHEGKHNYSLDIINKIFSSKKLLKQTIYNLDEPSLEKNYHNPNKINKLKIIINKLKSLNS